MIARRPTLYELNTAVWLRQLGGGLGGWTRATGAALPDLTPEDVITSR